MNPRDAEPRTHGSTTRFTGSAFICKHWGWKSHCRQTNTRVPASLLSGSGTCSQQSSPPFTMSACAYDLSLVWFPLCCCLTQAWFVVYTDASPLLHFQVDQYNVGTFLGHFFVTLDLPPMSEGADVLTEGTWLWQGCVGWVFLLTLPWHDFDSFGLCTITMACGRQVVEDVAAGFHAASNNLPFTDESVKGCCKKAWPFQYLYMIGRTDRNYCSDQSAASFF